MTPTIKTLIIVLITAIVAGSVTYYVTNSSANVERQAWLDQMSGKDVKKPATASPAASSTPTSSKYTKLTSTFGYTTEFPSTWSMVRTHSCEGACAEYYRRATTSKTQTNVLDQDALDPITFSVVLNSDTGASLATELAQLKDIQNVKDVTVGTGKYAAKRFDDGGGFAGLTITYLVFVPLKEKNEALVFRASYLAEKTTDTDADIQHMLDTLTVTK